MRDTIGDTSVQKQVDSALDDNPGMRSRVYSADHVGPSGTAGTTKESQTPRKKLAVTAPTKPAAKSEDTPSANGATSPKPSKPAASPKQTITKGIAPRSDANHKEDTTTKISSPRHTRSKSLAHGSEGLSLNRAPLYTSLAASPAKINPLITQPRLNDTTVPSKTRPPPARPTKTGQTGQPAPAPKLQVSDFDPLKRTSSAPPDVPGNVMPVISIPTQVSLEAVPLNSSSPLFQSTAEPTYSASSAPLSAQFSQGTIVGYLPHNPNVANGIHELQQQSFMFLPQQQPFMLQQVTGGVNEFSNVVTGQWAQTIPSSYPPVYMNGLQQQVPQQQQQQQHVSQQPLQQQQNGSLNSYDAFTSDPFDEQHVSQQLPQQQQNGSLNPYDAFTSDPFDDLLTRRTMD